MKILFIKLRGDSERERERERERDNPEIPAFPGEEN